jgi:phospholipid/cholesterol/gamma-HCH transport system substrate-binding protein
MTRDLPLHQRALAGGIGATLVVAATAVAVHAAFGGFDGGYELVGTFDRAGQGLDRDADVKLRGVTVGEVESIELGDDRRAVVRLRIDDGVRVPDTATAAIAPISVFGPTYVQLEPGEHEQDGPFLGDGDTIASTRAPLEFTDVLGDAQRLLEAVDPTELATIVSELADGLRGTGDDLATLVDDGGALVDLAARHRADAERFLGDVAALGEELGTRGDELVAALDGLGVGLEPVARRPDAFGRLLDDTRRVATELADLLHEHADAVGAGISAGAAATEVVVAHLGDLPGYLESLDTYFDVLGRSIRLPGPGGALLATQKFFLPDDLCLFVVGLCPAGGTVALPVPELPPEGSPPITLPPLPIPPVITIPGLLPGPDG